MTTGKTTRIYRSSHKTLARSRWLLAFATLIAASSGCFLEHLDELCSFDTYTVAAPIVAGVGGDTVGPGGDRFCDWNTGECEDLRTALNTTNLCSFTGHKTVELPAGVEFTIGIPNLPPGYRMTQSARSLRRIGDQVGLPHVLADVTIQGRGSVIEMADSLMAVRHFHVDEIGALELIDLTLRGARGVRAGGSIYNEGLLEAQSVVFEQNEASREGGAIYNARGAETVVADSHFERHQAWSGAAIFDAGLEPDAVGICPPGVLSLSIDRSEFVDNLGVVGPGTIVQLERCTRAEIVDTIFDGNTSIAGALQSWGELLLRSSTLSNNSGIYAGGLDVFAQDTVVESSTFTGNEGDYGAAIRCDSDPNTTLELSDVTIAANVSTLFSGSAVLASRNCQVSATNTIIGENTGGDCVLTNPVIEMGVNATTDGSCFALMLPTPLKLGALTDNGGPTETMLPAADSPLVDAGSVCFRTDQRGYPRPVRACDLGAVELQAVGDLPPLIPPPCDNPLVCM